MSKRGLFCLMTEEASFVYSKCIWLFGELVQLLVNFADLLVSLVQLLVNFADLLVSLVQLLVNFADLLVSLVHLLVNFADLLVSLTEFNPIIMKRCKALLSG
ncbi:hypothetical protein ACE8FZ_00255 [Peribacillus frigoritolerans]|uniref:hypothetical protein n=1 Tax=Bacillaceae TaxID=186817 RepID=UPI00128B9FD6|nr:hypothetical protein [Bacillus sp. 445_BSPC]